MFDWLAEKGTELLVTAVVCLVAYPVIRIGWHLRTSIRLKRRGYRGEQLRKSVRYSVVGAVLAVAAGVVLGIAGPEGWWVRYAVISTILVLLGCFGYALIPEDLAD
jgi:ABC-type Fe3+ transport system permease subunit